ncbi:hypothetical protein Tco_0829527 [Tanacetum coccineum]
MGQLKKLKPDELKEEFDKCVEKVEKFIPMNSELEASKLKRTGINLQAKVFKKQKITDVPDVTKDESVKREEEFKVQQPILRYNIRKSLARKGLQKNKSESARSDTEEDVEAYMDERVDEPSSEEFQMGSIPQGSAPAKIVKWQFLKTDKKGAYQIIREDHTDVVYVNFPGLLNDLTRDDLKELYKLMMLKYGDSRPEEEYERVLWGDLKTMFDPPSTEDVVWSLTHQQKVLDWRYFHSCAVHCLSLEAAHIYMLTEVKYPLPSRICQDILEKRLIRDRKDEEAHNEDTQRNLKFTSEDQVRGGLLGIIVNRLKSGSYRVRSGGHNMLKKFDLASVKTAITLMETKMALTKDEEADEVDVTPKTSHLNAVKRIFKYLKGKPNLGLWYPRESSFDLEAYSDSDYAGANLDRKSTTGGCQFLRSRLISWQCKKQTIVATSTTEAEYVAAASCYGQVLWIQNQMLDYGFNFMNTKIHIDNESTICIVKIREVSSRQSHRDQTPLYTRFL